MPTYVYRREDGSTFEVQQRITEPALEQCPETGQKVTRVISGNAGLIFKGSGFYLTDYVRNNGNGANGSKSAEASKGEAASKNGEASTPSKAESSSKSEA